MRHSLPQVTVDKTKNYPTQLYGYLAIRFGQINIIYPQKSPASLEIQGLQDFNNYSHSTAIFVSDVILSIFFIFIIHIILKISIKIGKSKFLVRF